MKLSIVFSSYNGEYTLPRMLDAFLKLDNTISLNYEIIAVNNNSVDSTQHILDGYCPFLPLKIIFEKKQGKNIALNHALKHATGDLIIFTDDDVIPNRNWLFEYKKLAQDNPSYDIFGGKISPYWELQPRKELLEAIPIGTVFAITNDHLNNGEIQPHCIWGPNMAIRRSIIDKGIIFNESIGPSGLNYAMGSETDYLERLENKGYKAFYSNKVEVHHIIRKWQLTPKWIRGRAYRAGRGFFRKEIRKTNSIKCTTLFGWPRWILLKILNKYLLLLLFQFSKNSKQYYKVIWDLYSTLGYAYESKVHFRNSSE